MATKIQLAIGTTRADEAMGEPSARSADQLQQDQRNKMYEMTATLMPEPHSAIIHVISLCLPLECALIYAAVQSTRPIDVLFKLVIFGNGTILICVIVCWIVHYLSRLIMRRRKILHGLKMECCLWIVSSVCSIAQLAYFWLDYEPGQKRLKQAILGVCILQVLISTGTSIIKFLLQQLEYSFCWEYFFDRTKESLAHEHLIAAFFRSASVPVPVSERRSTEGETEEQPQKLTLACVCGYLWQAVRFLTTLGISFLLEWEFKRRKREVKVDICELLKVPDDEVPPLTKQLVVSAISESASWSFQKDGPSFRNQEQVANAAHDIFTKFAAPHNSDYIELEHLKTLLMEDLDAKDILDQMLPIIEVDKDGHMTKQSFSAWMVKAYKFRMDLKRSVANNRKFYMQLTSVFIRLFLFMAFVILLGFTETVKWDILALFSAQIAAGAFIFRESTKKAFEGVVYIFIFHPFDIGDCCVIGGIPVVIESMNILKTTVRRFDKQLMCYPNTTLATLPISNYTRNPHTGDSLEFSIDITTPKEKIEQLKQEIKGYLENYNYHWLPEFSLVLKEVNGAMDKMTLVFNFNHTINFREFAVRDERKLKLLFDLRKIFKELDLNNE